MKMKEKKKQAHEKCNAKPEPGGEDGRENCKL